MAEHGEMIRRVAADYGVQPRFIVAIIGLESNYGTYPDRRAAVRRRRDAGVRRPARRAVSRAVPRCARDRRQGSCDARADEELVGRRARRAAVHADERARDRRRSRQATAASICGTSGRTSSPPSRTTCSGRAGAPIRLGAARSTLPAGGEETLAAPMADGATPPTVCRSYESLGAFRDLSDWQALGVRSADGSDLPTRDLPAALVVGDARRRPRLARLPQFLLADALQPGVPLRAVGRLARRRDRQRRTAVAARPD